MKILAFDIGVNMGVAFGDAHGPPSCHTEVLAEPGSSHPVRFCQALRMSSRLIDKLRPDVVVIEKPIAAGVAGSEARVQYAMGYRGCIFGVAQMKGVRATEFTVFEIREYLIGDGKLKRDIAKPAVFEACKGFGWSVSNYDESDAAAVWHFARAKLARVSVIKGLFGDATHTA